MKTKAIVIAAIAACLSSGAAFAQSYGYDTRGDRYERNDRYERGDREYRGDRDYRRGDRYHRQNRRAEGAGPQRDIFVGEKLPQAYWSPQFVVRNWARRDLPAPRQGHTWKRVGNDYVMSSVHTGVIAAVILH